MNNIVLSATNKKMEHFVVPMFTSFIKFNPDIHMYCIIADDVSDSVKIYLEHLGVHLIKYQPDSTTAKTPAKALMHLKLVAPDYIPNFDKVMCLDSDILVLDNILDLFDYSEDIVAHGGFNGKNWWEKSEDGKTYIAFGVSVITHDASCRLRDLYRKYGEQNGDDGDFIRKHLEDFSIHKIPTPLYYFGNILIEDAKYLNGKIVYTFKDIQYTPKIAHFTKHWEGRSRSVEIDKWCLDNGVQLRHEASD